MYAGIVRIQNRPLHSVTLHGLDLTKELNDSLLLMTRRSGLDESPLLTLTVTTMAAFVASILGEQCL